MRPLILFFIANLSFAQVNVNDIDYSSSLRRGGEPAPESTLESKGDNLEDANQNLNRKIKELKSSDSIQKNPKLYQHLRELEKKSDPYQKMNQMEIPEAVDETVKVFNEKLSGEDSVTEDMSFSQKLQRTSMFQMKRSPFADMSEDRIDVLLESHPSPLIANLMKTSPNLKKVMIKIMKHEKIIPNLMKIPKAKMRMRYYGIYAAILLALVFAWGLVGERNLTISRRLLKRFLMFNTLFLANLFGFYYFFRPELKDLVDVILNVLTFS